MMTMTLKKAIDTIDSLIGYVDADDIPQFRDAQETLYVFIEEAKKYMPQFKRQD